MPLTLQNIRNGILRATGTEVDDWSNGNDDLDLFANKSWWDVMDQFDFREREAVPVTFETVMGTVSYSMSTIMSPVAFDALQRVSIVDPNSGQHTDLELIQDFTYENEYINDSSFQAAPTKYFRRNDKIYLYPTPDQAYTINVYSLQTLSDIPDSGPIIPQSWHEIIELGAKYRACEDLGNLVKATYFRNAQADRINSRTSVKAKELSDTKLAGVEVPGRDY